MINKYDDIMSKAQMAFVNAQYNYCIDLCCSAIEIEPSSVTPYSLKGNSHLVLNQFEMAENDFRRAIELDDKNGERYFDLGNSLFGQQRLSEALESYAAATQFGCREEILKKIYYIMGVINQVSQNNYKDALLNYEKSDKLPGDNTDQADILLKKIQIYVEQRDFFKAENCAIQLKYLLPSEFQSYQLLFQLYLEQKKTSEAKIILDEAEKNVDLDQEIKIEIGFDRAMLSCFLAEQTPEEKNKYYEQALKQLAALGKSGMLGKKDRCEVLITSSEIYLKLEKYDMAVKLSGVVAAYTEDELKEYIERGRYILLECSDKKKDYLAVRKYAKLLKESKNLFYKHHGYYSEAYAVKKLTEINQSFQHECSELYNIAIAYYRNCTVASPGDFLAYLYRAKSYVDIGKYDKAEEIGKLLPEDAQKSLSEYISHVRK